MLPEQGSLSFLECRGGEVSDIAFAKNISDVVFKKMRIIIGDKSTRKLRKLLSRDIEPGKSAKILFATLKHNGISWKISINVEVCDVHESRKIKTATAPIGIDLGLNAFAVASTGDGTEVFRAIAPKPLKSRLRVFFTEFCFSRANMNIQQQGCVV